MIKKITKSINLEYTGQNINLPKDLNDKIKIFWSKAIIETPTLYNGEDYAVEDVTEKENEIIMKVSKTNYAHYLYDERIGIDDEKYRCICPWSGILLLTNDNYWVFGQASEKTSFPNGFQISGGGIDKKDIYNSKIDLTQNLKRELKEEMNLNLDEIKYEFQYIEYPDDKRNAYGFIAIGYLNMTKNELQNHFKQYKEFLEKNNLEVEFNNLIFLKRGNAVQELDTYNNSKRNYLRELISRVDYNIKSFVFDFGNVLFGWDIDDIVKHYADNEKDRLELKEIIFQSNEWSMLDNGTLNYNEAKEIFKNKISKHLEGKLDEILNSWYEQMPINYQICDLIKRLKRNNYKVYALSNTHIQVYEYVKKLDIGKYFDGFIISAIEKMMKPNKNIYNRLYEKYELIPEECLFIDDSEKNILSAEECGMHGYVFDINNMKIGEIEEFSNT